MSGPEGATNPPPSKESSIRNELEEYDGGTQMLGCFLIVFLCVFVLGGAALLVYLS